LVHRVLWRNLLVGTGNSITVTPSTTTTYYYRNRSYQDVGYSNTLENFSTGCASITINVATQPAVGTISVDQNCSGNPTINSTGHTGSIDDYTLTGSTTLGGVYTDVSTSGTLPISFACFESIYMVENQVQRDKSMFKCNFLQLCLRCQELIQEREI
jgi:hypothetical protein